MTHIAIFFSSGAFGDCARHAILHALSVESGVQEVTIYSNERNMPTLNLANYKCGCGDDIHHGEDFERMLSNYGSNPNDKKQVERVVVDVTNSKEVQEKVNLSGVDAVISGLGNRQMFIGDRVARQGTNNILKIMKRDNVHRIVIMTSMGINEDKPCMEWRSEGKFMTALFNTVSLREYRDLSRMEKDVRKASDNGSDLNYLLVRPVGLGEECVPRGEYFVQKKKFDDALGPNMAKSDVGLFLLDQVRQPTYNNVAVVVGADPREAHVSFMEAGLTKEVKAANDEEEKKEHE
mmetsp:Transcript_39473/g.72818  ORF Transcript_39473/g.72818 Transcript_39473/m.72818 type:complete len:292 (-) Transcript_39473:42-917(-)